MSTLPRNTGRTSAAELYGRHARQPGSELRNWAPRLIARVQGFSPVRQTRHAAPVSEASS